MSTFPSWVRCLYYTAALALCSTSLAAQAVVLPAARTIGPSPAQQKLLQLASDAAQWYKPPANADAATIRLNAQRQAVLDYARFRFLLAPLDSEALSRIACNPRQESLWTQLYRESGAVRGAGMQQLFGEVLKTGPLSGNAKRDTVLIRLALGGLKELHGESLANAIAIGAAAADSAAAKREQVSGSSSLTLAKSWIDAATQKRNAGDREGALAQASGAAGLLTDAAAHFTSAAASMDSLVGDLKELDVPADRVAQARVTGTALLASADTLKAVAVDVSKADLKADAASLVAAGKSVVGRQAFLAQLPATLPGIALAGGPVPVLPISAKRNRTMLTRSDTTITVTCSNSTSHQILSVDETETIQVGSALQVGETDEARKGKLDELARTARLTVIERELAVHWLPVRSSDQAYAYWRQAGLSPLNVGSVVASGTSAAAMTEIAAPMIHSVRLSLNAVVATSKPSAASTTPATQPTSSGGSGSAALAAGTTTNGNSSDALSQLLSAGGQLNANAALPLFSWRDPEKESAATLLFMTRLGGTSGNLGATQSDATAYVDPGLDLHLTTLDLVSNIGAFAQMRLARATVGQALRTSLDVPKTFSYTAISGGLIVSGKYLISVGRTMGKPASLAKTRWQWGVSVLNSAQ
jgi:hypothetical protein